MIWAFSPQGKTYTIYPQGCYSSPLEGKLFPPDQLEGLLFERGGKLGLNGVKVNVYGGMIDQGKWCTSFANISAHDLEPKLFLHNWTMNFLMKLFFSEMDFSFLVAKKFILNSVKLTWRKQTIETMEKAGKKKKWRQKVKSRKNTRAANVSRIDILYRCTSRILMCAIVRSKRRRHLTKPQRQWWKWQIVKTCYEFVNRSNFSSVGKAPKQKDKN